MIYARPDGWHYHLDRKCSMLQGGDFERLAYIKIHASDIMDRKLDPCTCVFKKLNIKTERKLWIKLLQLEEYEYKVMLKSLAIASYGKFAKELPYENAWLTLATCFGEQDKQEELKLMDSILKEQQNEIREKQSS